MDKGEVWQSKQFSRTGISHRYRAVDITGGRVQGKKKKKKKNLLGVWNTAIHISLKILCCTTFSNNKSVTDRQRQVDKTEISKINNQSINQSHLWSILEFCILVWGRSFVIQYMNVSMCVHNDYYYAAGRLSLSSSVWFDETSYLALGWRHERKQKDKKIENKITMLLHVPSLLQKYKGDAWFRGTMGCF